MTNHRLTYSRRTLLAYAVLGGMMGVTALLLSVSSDDLLSHRRIGVFAALGPAGLRVLLGVGGLFMLAMAWNIVRRLRGDGTAAEIRHDGVALHHPMLTQFVRWRGFDRVTVKARRINGKTLGFVSLETNEHDDTSLGRRISLKCLSWGIGSNLIEQDLVELVEWAERANAARREALNNRPPAPPTAAADSPSHPQRPQFGRKVGGLR